ncbi:Diacylglycerol O-acyltransferase [Pseudomonas pohangensis]|uniref:diacylglycerol O-acyltransferase n=1 Tax=Pseudomonas pohangensis TaxID=364197 RepID=A0A1H2HRY4_9PSED|nr:wax ester/triacylglycerol synthase family O-acyltransferase [Pseudomonas pohangensis]SDU34670.1 Diacylglycerol O-acyltransferase [Pseudomonas pohangensis]
MRQLSGMDNLFLALEDNNQHMHVGGLGIYDPSTAPGGKVRFKGVLEFFEKRLNKSKVFRRRLVNLPLGIDRPYWIDTPEIDVEYHIRHIALPKPGDWRQLCIQVARLHARPLDMSMPAWECYVIEGLDNISGIPPGSFAFYIKMHHSAIDGEAGAELMKAIHSLSSVDDSTQDKSAIIADREPSTIELLARTVGHRASMVGDTSRLLLDIGKLGLNFGRNYLQRMGEEPQPKSADEPKAVPGKAPVTRFDMPVSAHRVVEALGLPMREIQEIRSKVPGATVNDVFMAVTGGALRKYLGDKHELPAASLNAMVPMTTRGAKKDADVGNQVGMSAMPICTDIADPIERLNKVRRGSSKTKQATSSVGKDLPGKLINLLPAVAGKMLITKGLLPLVNLTISNVRGPDVPLYLAGAQMVLFLPVSIPMDNLGLNITGFSYNGTLWVCVTVCRQMMPDPAVFAQCYRESFEELLLATKKMTAAAPDKGAAKPGAAARSSKVSAAKPPSRPAVAKTAAKTAGSAPAAKTPVKAPAAKPAAKPAARKAPLQPPANRPPLKKVERKPLAKAAAKAKTGSSGQAGKAASKNK